MKTIYLDHHATTPVDKEVLDEMLPFFMQNFGNASSNTHEYGHIARSAVENARKQLAQLIAAKSADEIIFTSGATESDNLAIKGVAAKHTEKKGRIITIATEHKAILDTVKRLAKEGFDIQYVNLDKYGIVDLDHLTSLITPETLIVSIQAANSEIGTIQPLKEIGQITQEKNVLFHTDAVQALGKIDVNVVRDNVDMLSVSAHKMYGPKGVGALYVKKGIKLVPLIDGGGHERGMRSGTLNVPGIVGMGKAAEIAQRDMDKNVEHLLSLRNRLAKGIEANLDHIKLNGHPEKRLPNNLNYSFAFVEGESLILACRDVALSSGSACTSASLQSSYVLHAINVPESLAHCSIRFGLGKINTNEHVDFLIDLLSNKVKKLREMSPLYDLAKEGVDIDKMSWSDHSH